MKVTADTIADEQIRELWSDGLGAGDRALNQIAQVALGTWHGAHHHEASDTGDSPWCIRCQRLLRDDQIHIFAARRRCAEIWNARQVKDGAE